ncbi:MAG: phosphoglycerate mutase [Pseudoxanthomonas sp.]
MAAATLLLPARARLAGTLDPAAGRLLARADRSTGDAGEAAQLRRHFQLVPDHWPVAALTRQLDAGDAAGLRWLRADPAYMAPDMNGARMLAHGPGLQLDARDCAELLPLLKPLFGDAGFPIDAPTPSRWYLRLPREARLPAFTPVAEVLGDDLFEHLPQGEAGRRWRALFNEAQVLLHQHPWNAQRMIDGKPALNALWFWGEGVLPDFVRTPFKQVKSNEPLLRALAKMAGVATDAAGDDVDALVDLRHLRSLETLGRDALQPLCDEIAAGRLQALHLDFEDGARFALERRQRWRFWRRPLASLASQA